MSTEFFECQCRSDEHTLKFILEQYSDDSNDLEIYTSVFLYEGSWWQRLWIAVKYVFGYKCRYGHWDNFIMRHEDVDRMLKLCQQYKDIRNPAN